MPIFYNVWLEIYDLKNGTDDSRDKVRFFKRGKIMSCLDVIFREMFSDGENSQSIPVNSLPDHLLRLDLMPKGSHNFITLEVDSGLLNRKIYKIHTFRLESSAVLSISEQLFNGIQKIWVDVTKTCDSNGVKNAAKYLERTKMDNVLGDSFFEKNGKLVRLKTRAVNSKSLSYAERLELEVLLTRLKPLD